MWQTPIVMKKGRSAVLLSVLAAESDMARMAARVSELTGTLGVRVRMTERFVAPREIVEVATEWGPVRVKAGAGRLRPEHDDVARIARETGLRVRRRGTRGRRSGSRDGGSGRLVGPAAPSYATNQPPSRSAMKPSAASAHRMSATSSAGTESRPAVRSAAESARASSSAESPGPAITARSNQARF